MANRLVEFWDEAALACAPYVHPHDAIAENKIQELISSYDEYVAAFESDRLRSNALHLGLLPQPYLGDLDNAEIILLLSNPGLSACDYHLEQNYPAYRESLIDSIRQVRRSHLFLDPKWAWTSGFVWWERKLRDVAKEIALKCFDRHYGQALADLGRRIASIELVPYHSFNFDSPKNLASSIEALNFVKSIDSSRTIIVTRSVAAWDLPDAANIVKYPPQHARSASLGPETMGGRAILERYGITSG